MILELTGQPALSSFRVDKLARLLKRSDRRVESVDAKYVYFVATRSELDRDERSRLDALLLSGVNFAHSESAYGVSTLYRDQAHNRPGRRRQRISSACATSILSNALSAASATV